jgi:hypothetical protein
MKLLPDSSVVCIKCGHYLTDSYERDRLKLVLGHVCGTGGKPGKSVTIEELGIQLRDIRRLN